MKLIDRFRPRGQTPSSFRGRWRPPTEDGIFLNDQARKNRRSAPEAPPPGRHEEKTSPAAIETQKARKTLLQLIGYGSDDKVEPEQAVAAVPKKQPEHTPLAGAAKRPQTVAPRLAGSAPPRAQPMDKAPKPERRKLNREDFTLAALGVTLAAICALFPWYIFFNQDKFGVREMVFQGTNSSTAPSQLAYQPQLIGEHFQTGDMPRMDLDFLPTATLRDPDSPPRAVPVSEQPFPSDLIQFRLVHVANGRAMIEDEDGLWIVQPGSRLPDASQVSSIEQREGRWVLVTSLDKVVELTP